MRNELNHNHEVFLEYIDQVTTDADRRVFIYSSIADARPVRANNSVLFQPDANLELTGM